MENNIKKANHCNCDKYQQKNKWNEAQNKNEQKNNSNKYENKEEEVRD